MKVKKILIWIPLLGIIIPLIFDYEDRRESIYDLYFDYGSPILVLISVLWHLFALYGLLIFFINQQ